MVKVGCNCGGVVWSALEFKIHQNTPEFKDIAKYT